MNRKVQLGLSLAAGLLGGVLARDVSPELVHAAQVVPVPAKEIRARSFVLVNEDGSPAGLSGFDRDGRPNIVLFDRAGKVVWSADGKANSRPLAVNAEK
jgi:hypothetical protein